MLILINGLPHFSRIMAADLNEFDAENRYIFINTYESKLEQIKFILLLPFCGAVISFNGVSDVSNSMNWVLKMKKRLFMQWQGTDVSIASDRFNEGTICRKYIDYSTHIVSSSWFKDELKEIVKDTTYLPFSYVNTLSKTHVYDNVNVFSYIAKGRENFYGWGELIALAQKYKDISFTIAGTDGEGLDYPSNVTCIGWVDEKEFLKQLDLNAIFIRLTEHDGKSISIAQALAYGCEVIWTYDFECCHQISKNFKELDVKFIELKDKIGKRDLTSSNENTLFAKNNLLREPVLVNYVEGFKTLLNG